LVGLLYCPGRQGPGLGALRLAASGRHWSPRREDGMQEPCEPHALPLALKADAIHSVVPVPRPHQREAMDSHAETPIERPRTMLEERPMLGRDARLEIGRQLSGGEHRPLEEWDGLVEDRLVTGHVELVARHAGAPEGGGGGAGADA